MDDQLVSVSFSFFLDVVAFLAKKVPFFLPSPSKQQLQQLPCCWPGKKGGIMPVKLLLNAHIPGLNVTVIN